MDVLDVAGAPRERGRAHGEALRERIAVGLELWREHARPAGRTEHYVDTARRWTPATVEELEGIAEGAAAPFPAVVAYNLGDELRVFGALERCTSARLQRNGLGPPVSGQTMDTPGWFAELRVAIRSDEENGLSTLAFTIAGVLSLCGVNSAGVGVWCNALYQVPSSPDGVPVTCIVRHLLSQPSLAGARAFAQSVPHASGQHYLLASPPGRSDWRRLLSEWGLAEKRDAAFAGLSGGERQRLFVALALVNDPEIVFLDELTQGLDPGARRTAWELIRALRDRGTTVVLVTHFMDEAERLCDRVAVLVDGRVVALDTPQGLVNRYGGSTSLTFSLESAELDWLGRLPHVRKVSRQSRVVRVEGSGPVVTLVAAELARRGIVPSDLRVEHDTLEDVYLTLTGGAS